eukprot:403352121
MRATSQAFLKPSHSYEKTSQILNKNDSKESLQNIDIKEVYKQEEEFVKIANKRKSVSEKPNKNKKQPPNINTENQGGESSSNKNKDQAKIKVKTQKNSNIKKSDDPVKINLVNAKYDVIKECANEMGWQIIDNPHVNQEDFDLYWNDVQISIDKLQSLKPYQKVNHFPSMYQITRKGMLAKNLLKMKKVHSADYDFFPKTWILPKDMRKLKQYFQSKGDNPPFLICKPDGLSQGKGIFMTNKLEDINTHMSSLDQEKKQIIIVQKYIKKPYLIDNLKFDLRIYVLVTCCNPMKIFLYDEGLARFATSEYTLNNLDDTFVHLTNYAINKNSENFQENEEIDAQTGTKRSLKSIFQTLLAVQSELLHNYRMNQPQEKEGQLCFEILGFDILIDQRGKPWLLEVNQAPSFNTDTKLDYQVKKNLIMDTFKLLNITKEIRQRIMDRMDLEKRMKVMNKKDLKVIQEKKLILEHYFIQQNLNYEKLNLGGFSKIYPLIEGYNQILQQENSTIQSERATTNNYYSNSAQIQEYYQVFLNTSNMFMCDTVVKKINDNRKKFQNQTQMTRFSQDYLPHNSTVYQYVSKPIKEQKQYRSIDRERDNMEVGISANMRYSFKNYYDLLDFIIPRQINANSQMANINSGDDQRQIIQKEMIIPIANQDSRMQSFDNNHLMPYIPNIDSKLKIRNQAKDSFIINKNNKLYHIRDRSHQTTQNVWIQKMKKVQEQRSPKKDFDSQFNLLNQQPLTQMQQSLRESIDVQKPNPITINTNTHSQLVNVSQQATQSPFNFGQTQNQSILNFMPIENQGDLFNQKKKFSSTKFSAFPILNETTQDQNDYIDKFQKASNLNLMLPSQRQSLIKFQNRAQKVREKITNQNSNSQNNNGNQMRQSQRETSLDERKYNHPQIIKMQESSSNRHKNSQSELPINDMLSFIAFDNNQDSFKTQEIYQQPLQGSGLKKDNGEKTTKMLKNAHLVKTSKGNIQSLQKFMNQLKNNFQ